MADNKIIYDGDCPFCSRYVALIRLRESIGPVQLINVREHPDVNDQYLTRGINLDEGMILILDRKEYFGADCVNRLALLSSGSTLFNKLNAAIFRYEWLSSFLYPIMRFGRNLTITILGRAKLNPR